jgi:hypothetical protein
LQYKSEGAVPPPIRRAINRASALLETVDLEFDRVLAERASYIQHEVTAGDDSAPLNVDSLAAVLNKLLPAQNKDETEPYASLLEDLHALGVNTAADLEAVLSRRRTEIAKQEADRVRAERENTVGKSDEAPERVNRGVYYTHVGLARAALREEFGHQAVNKLFATRRSREKKVASTRKRSN